ncbi:MAG: glutamate 5-kinase [Lachnospiraceae bacterium]|jgi:glutamate 5-kinase|nr:glutamate 5-kinase [Lachnospiraceae bacterium]
MINRDALKDKKRIVVKIGSSSLTHKETGLLDFVKLEKLVRVLTNLRNQGKEVILVSSGAIAVGRKKLGLRKEEMTLSKKQACAAVGQAQLMMTYQKIFSEYNQPVAQILLTKITMMQQENKSNAENTFLELLSLGVIPIVNENDTVSTYEIQFGDNDRLSALVTALTGADLLILLSDIDGLYTDDPNVNKDAKFVEVVEKLDDDYMDMGKETSSSQVGTGGMSAKLVAAKIATYSGADMVIANGSDVDVINAIMNGENVGTLFMANKKDDFDLVDEVQ